MLTQQRIYAMLTVGIPSLGTVWALVRIPVHGFGLTELVSLVLMYLLTGVGVEVGLHRFLSHRVFKANRWVTLFFGIAGSMAAQGPVLFWAATHRRHHAFTDDVGDPHSPRLHGHDLRGRLKGFFYAHVGWMFTAQPQGWPQYAMDLQRNRTTLFLHRSYLLWVLLGLALPAVVAYALTGDGEQALSALLWGGFVRIFLVDHATWSINSFSHTFGRRMPGQAGGGSRNLSWLVLPTFGGGWHHNHHCFPGSARTGLHAGEFDPGGALIGWLQRRGWVSDVRVVDPSQLRPRTGS